MKEFPLGFFLFSNISLPVLISALDFLSKGVGALSISSFLFFPSKSFKSYFYSFPQVNQPLFMVTAYYMLFSYYFVLLT